MLSNERKWDWQKSKEGIARRENVSRLRLVVSPEDPSTSFHSKQEEIIKVFPLFLSSWHFSSLFPSLNVYLTSRLTSGCALHARGSTERETVLSFIVFYWFLLNVNLNRRAKPVGSTMSSAKTFQIAHWNLSWNDFTTKAVCRSLCAISGFTRRCFEWLNGSGVAFHSANDARDDDSGSKAPLLTEHLRESNYDRAAKTIVLMWKLVQLLVCAPASCVIHLALRIKWLIERAQIHCGIKNNKQLSVVVKRKRWRGIDMRNLTIQ